MSWKCQKCSHENPDPYSGEALLLRTKTAVGKSLCMKFAPTPDTIVVESNEDLLPPVGVIHLAHKPTLTPGMKAAKKAFDEERYADAAELYTAELAAEEAKPASSWVQLSHLNNELPMVIHYAESQFWAEPQFMCEPGLAGWRVIPNTEAPNETQLNGRAIISPQIVGTGDVLSVGRESKGIIKLPLQLNYGREGSCHVCKYTPYLTLNPVSMEQAQMRIATIQQEVPHPEENGNDLTADRCGSMYKVYNAIRKHGYTSMSSLVEQTGLSDDELAFGFDNCFWFGMLAHDPGGVKVLDRHLGREFFEGLFPETIMADVDCLQIWQKISYK